MLLLSVCQIVFVLGYNELWGYDCVMLKLVFFMDLGMCLNWFIYDFKLVLFCLQVVVCDSWEVWICNDGFYVNVLSCMWIDYELIIQNYWVYYCLKYLVWVGYCYLVVMIFGKLLFVLLYVLLVCDELLFLLWVVIVFVFGICFVNWEFS